MFLLGRRRLEAAMAALVYDEATPRERLLVEEAVARDPALRREVEALRALRGAMPGGSPELRVDLAPLVRDRLETVPATARGRRLALVLGTVVCVGVLGILGLYRTDRSASPIVSVAPAHPSPLSSVLASAETLASQGSPGVALESLREALAAHPGDVRAGEVQLRIADLAYDLKRYPEALAAMTALMTQYHAFVAQSPERERHVIARRDLLAEAEAVQFATLYALDTARKDRTNPLGRLEEVIVANQDSLVAEEAALDMGRLLLAEAEERPDAASPRLTAMTLARDRCANPVAAALLEVKIGEIYQNDLRDFSSAEEHFKRAAENPAVAKRATVALAVLAKERQR